MTGHEIVIVLALVAAEDARLSLHMLVYFV
jgi:hypothetical protein